MRGVFLLFIILFVHYDFVYLDDGVVSYIEAFAAVVTDFIRVEVAYLALSAPVANSVVKFTFSADIHNFSPSFYIILQNFANNKQIVRTNVCFLCFYLL